MAVFKSVPYERLAFGDVIKLTLVTVKEKPVFFLSLAALVAAPSAIGARLGFGIQGSIAEIFLTPLVYGAIVYRVFQSREGWEATPGQALGAALRRFGPVFCVQLVMILVNVLFVALPLLVGLGVQSLGIGICLILILLVPVLLITCAWLVAAPACVVEKLGLLASFQRSQDLTSGYRRKIFDLLVVVSLVSWLIFWLSDSLLDTISGGPMLTAGFRLKPPLVLLAGKWIIAALGKAFSSVLIAIIYYDLRTIKEGPAAAPSAEATV